MKKYILALFLGLSCALHGQSLYAQTDDIASDDTAAKQETDQNSVVLQKDKNLLSADWWKTATLEKVKEEIKNGADINAKGNDRAGQKGDGNLRTGVSPLIFALKYGNPSLEIVQTLIDAGADVNAKEETYGTTVLMYAENPEIIRTLIENGADVNAKDKNGYTFLMYAVADNYELEIVETLLKNGADVNAKSNKGSTPLMLADKYNPNPKVGKILREHIVKTAKVYDCPNGQAHRLCGVFENKTSDTQEALIQISYYDKSGIKLGIRESDSVEIVPYGQAKFETKDFGDSFDHYKIELKLL